MPDACDLLVIGGGPAGSTLAGLVKKHAPDRRVILLEKAPGPRHHVGESLLPGMVPVLKELGVYEKIDAAGFPRKLGATYIWGPDRTPWENDFNDVNIAVMVERYGRVPPKIEYAWQVVRSKYDEILLKHAEGLGVEVWRGARAEGLLERGERITGLTVARAGGRVSVRAGLVADCSGQDGFLSKYRNIREFNPALKNVAVYAYFKGARWKYEYTGHPDKTKIFICTTPAGWLWYIPLAKDLVSVGLVTMVEHVKKRRIKDLRGLLLRELRACAELAPLLKNAEPARGFDGGDRDFFTHKDWSYLSRQAAGPGWLAAGDAAVFVDPILSSGVTLAHLTGHRAAYTVLSAWKETTSSPRNALWKDYDLFCRESAAQYLVLALFWYGNDPCAERWWGKAAELQRALVPVEFSDKGAFVTVSAGLTQYYDRIFSTEALQREHETKPEEYPFYMTIFRQGQAPAPAQDMNGAAPRLKYPWKEEIVYVPKAKEAGLQPVQRVRFLKQDTKDPIKDAFNPRKLVTRWHLQLLAQIDGRRTTAEALAGAAAKGVPAWWLRGPAQAFLRDLAVQGVLEPTS